MRRIDHPASCVAVARRPFSSLEAMDHYVGPERAAQLGSIRGLLDAFECKFEERGEGVSLWIAPQAHEQLLNDCPLSRISGISPELITESPQV